jgi:hypothetical protein
VEAAGRRKSSQHKFCGAKSGVRKRKRPAIGCLVYQSLIASLPLRANKARSSYFALDFIAKNPGKFRG